MLKSPLLHPEMLAALGSAGHGSKVLVADGNYPFGTGANPAAARGYLNLAPGLIDATSVLKVLVQAIPSEPAEVMVPADGAEPPIFAEFRKALGPAQPLKTLGRFEFYEAARQRDTALVIATAEQRIYANVLLTVGVLMP